MKYSNFCDIKVVYTFFLINWILWFDYLKYFDEGMSQKDSRDDLKGPASTLKLIVFTFWERRFTARKRSYKETFETFLYSFWDLCSKITLKGWFISRSILSIFGCHFWELRAFGIRCLTSYFEYYWDPFEASWSVVTLYYNSSQQCNLARSIHANYNKRITVGIKSKIEDPFRPDH